MINSMTAFGRIQKEASGYSVILEIRTLNSRSLDIVLRLPKNYLEFEDQVRKQVAGFFRRGRVELFAQVETTVIEQKAPQINMALARLYWEQLQALHRELPGTDCPTLDHLLQIPYLFETREAENDRSIIGNLLSEALAEALEQIQQMRRQEGEALRDDLLGRLAALREGVSAIESRKDTIIQEYMRRVRDRIQELLGDIQADESRVIQEIAIFAERSDINEEIVRLKSHLDQMESLITSPAQADGRRLDFLTQELHREVNTIGCKTADLEAIQVVVGMKSEIGKLKEQVQNVE